MTPASSPSSAGRGQAIDNELDLRGLLCALWRGKVTVIACALAFALGALIYSFVVRQEWTAIAITDKPTVNVLGSYFSQQQFLRNLDVKNTALPTSDTPSIADEAYQEFLRQLASYDTRRDFWLASPYYQTRKKGDAHADAVLLDELINAIQYQPRDDVKKLCPIARGWWRKPHRTPISCCVAMWISPTSARPTISMRMSWPPGPCAPSRSKRR